MDNGTQTLQFLSYFYNTIEFLFLLPKCRHRHIHDSFKCLFGSGSDRVSPSLHKHAQFAQSLDKLPWICGLIGRQRCPSPRDYYTNKPTRPKLLALSPFSPQEGCAVQLGSVYCISLWRQTMHLSTVSPLDSSHCQFPTRYGTNVSE
jgi:hypothetical protein